MKSVAECIQTVKDAEENLKAARAKIERIESTIHSFASTSIIGFVGNSEKKISDCTGEYAAKISDAQAVEAEAWQEYKQAVMALVDALDGVSVDAGRIIQLRYIDGLKMGSVAREVGYTRAYCYRLLQLAGCGEMIKGPP